MPLCLMCNIVVSLIHGLFAVCSGIVLICLLSFPCCRGEAVHSSSTQLPLSLCLIASCCWLFLSTFLLPLPFLCLSLHAILPSPRFLPPPWFLVSYIFYNLILTRCQVPYTQLLTTLATVQTLVLTSLRSFFLLLSTLFARQISLYSWSVTHVVCVVSVRIELPFPGQESGTFPFCFLEIFLSIIKHSTCLRR